MEGIVYRFTERNHSSPHPQRLFNLGLAMGVWGPERSGKTHYLPSQTQSYPSPPPGNLALEFTQPGTDQLALGCSGSPADHSTFVPLGGKGSAWSAARATSTFWGRRKGWYPAASRLGDFIRLQPPPPPLGSREEAARRRLLIQNPARLSARRLSASPPKAVGRFRPVASVRSRADRGAPEPPAPSFGTLGPVPRRKGPQRGRRPEPAGDGLPPKADYRHSLTPRSERPGLRLRQRRAATSPRHTPPGGHYRPGRRCSGRTSLGALRSLGGPPALDSPGFRRCPTSRPLPDCREV